MIQTKIPVQKKAAVPRSREESKHSSGPQESEEDIKKRQAEAMKTNLNIAFLLTSHGAESSIKPQASLNSQGSDDYDPLAPNSK